MDSMDSIWTPLWEQYGIHLEIPWNPSQSTPHSIDSIWINLGRVKYWGKHTTFRENVDGLEQTKVDMFQFFNKGAGWDITNVDRAPSHIWQCREGCTESYGRVSCHLTSCQLTTSDHSTDPSISSFLKCLAIMRSVVYLVSLTFLGMWPAHIRVEPHEKRRQGISCMHGRRHQVGWHMGETRMERTGREKVWGCIRWVLSGCWGSQMLYWWKFHITLSPFLLCSSCYPYPSPLHPI